MATVHALGVAGTSPPTSTTVQVLGVSGTGTGGATSTVQVLGVAGVGTGQPVLTSPKSTYDPGETITVQAANRGTSDTFSASGSGLVVGTNGLPADAGVVDGLLTFTAPATPDGTTVTVAYNGLAFLTVTVGPAFALINGKGALISVSVP